MDSMFYNNIEFDGDLSTWSMSQVATTVSMFQNAASFRGTGVDLWDVSSVQNMTSMVSLWPRLVEVEDFGVTLVVLAANYVRRLMHMRNIK
jgi:Mycoplasma protein of unknown function, DUF285